MKDPRTKKIEELKEQNKALSKRLADLCEENKRLASKVNYIEDENDDLIELQHETNENLKHAQKLLKKEHDLNQSLLRRLLDED